MLHGPLVNYSWNKAGLGDFLMFILGRGGEMVVVWVFFLNVLSVIFTSGYCHREEKYRLMQLIWNSVHIFLAEAKSNKDCIPYLQITYMRTIDHVGD